MRQALIASSTRRDQILDAALSCFSTAGYAATTIDDIRTQSGASIGSLYHHFDGKESIATALYIDRLSRYEASFIDALTQSTNAKEGIRATVGSHLNWAETHPDDARFLLGHADIELRLAREDELPEHNRQFYRTVGGWVRSNVAAGHLRPLPPDLFYALWLGPAQEVARQWLVGRSRTKPTKATALLAESAWQAVRHRVDDDEK